MKIITKQGLASGAAERWKGHYQSQIWFNESSDKREIHKALVALGENPLPCDVDKVIGNNSWTYLSCDECSKEVEVVVQLGEEPNYESATAQICFPCLKKAVKFK